jgi:hypothetical protein
LLLVSFFFIQLFSVDIETSILETQRSLHVNDVSHSKEFKKLTTSHVNFGFDSKKTIWLKIELKNVSDKNINKVIVIDNPLLEKVFFYDNLVHKSGMLYMSSNRKEVFPSYSVELHKNEQKTIYVEIQNKTTTLQFGLKVLSKESFEKEDQLKQFSIMLFIGLLSSFIVYSLFLYIYTKDSSYYLYSFYLLTLMFQQLTYIGFLPLYAPSRFVYIDNLIVVPKVSLMIIAAALFAKKFLKMKQFPRLNRLYKILILTVLIQMPIFGTQFLYVPEVTVFLGLVFIVFNTYSGVYVYNHGNKQARFFLVGWAFLLVGYTMMIFDALGFITSTPIFWLREIQCTSWYK